MPRKCDQRFKIMSHYQIIKMSPNNITWVRSSDYHRLMSQLTMCEYIDEDEFTHGSPNFCKMSYSNSMVLLNCTKVSPVSSWLVWDHCIFIGRYYRSMSTSASIEDVVVDREHHSKNLGKKLIDHMVQQALMKKSYKVTLQCSNENVKFYQKCEFQTKNVAMERYF